MQDLPEWAEPREYEPRLGQHDTVRTQDEAPPPPPPPVPIEGDWILLFLGLLVGIIFLTLNRVTNTDG